MNIPNKKHPQECVWNYTLDTPQTPIALVRAVMDILDDLAFTHVGRWRPFELTLYITTALANNPDMPKALQVLHPWLQERNCAWRPFSGSSVCKLKISGQRIF